jgi:hypothetical protein
MRTSTKLGLTALMAAIMLSSAVATASARSLSVSEQSFRATWSSLELSYNGATIRCRVTLEGSFHARSIVKIARSLIGAITKATFGHPCTGGEYWADNGTEAEPLGTAPNRLPWHLTYESFTGTLPAISAVNFLISRVSFVLRVTVLGLTCQGRYGKSEDNITLVGAREAGGGLTELTPSATVNRISLVEQLGPQAVCAASQSIGGRGSVVNLSTGARITITLI